MALNVGELFAKLGVDDREFNRKLDSGGRKFSGFGSGLKRVAGKAAIGAGVALAGMAAKGIGEFSKLERGMNEVFTLLPDISGDAMADMTAQVRDFSKEFGTLPEETVPALYQAISAGVPQDNVFEFLETAQKAAIGGVTELETAVDGISSVVNAYGEDVIDATEASDLMFTAVKLGKTDFDQLSRSLFNVLPTASALGVKFGDVTGALAAMTAQGTPTTVATTQLRQMLVELSKSGSATASTFQDLSGQTFAEFIASGGNVQDALTLMADGAAADGKSIADTFGSVEAGMAATALTSDSGAEAFTRNLGEMDDAAGATEDAFGQMDQGVSRSFEKMKARANDTLISFGEELAPTVIELADSLMQLGETVLPLVETGMMRATQVARGLTFIVDTVGSAFGATDGRAGDMARNMEFLSMAMQDGEDPAVALANALRDMAATGDLTSDELKTLATQAGISDERLADVEFTLREYAKSGDDANVTTEELNEAFDNQIPKFGHMAGGMQDYMRATDDATDAVEDATDAEEDHTEAIDEATAALREQFDTIRAQTDPLFALRDATNEAAEAQKAVNEAVKKHGEGSPEHLDAIANASQANLDLRDAELGVAEAGALTRDEFIKQQTELGLTRDEARQLADHFEALNDFEFDPKRIDITAQIRATDLSTDRTAVSGRHRGGPVEPGELYEVGEHDQAEILRMGGRTFMIPGNRGDVFSNADLHAMMGGDRAVNDMMAQTMRMTLPAPQSPETGGGGRDMPPISIGAIHATAAPDSLVGELVDGFGFEVRWATP